MDLNHGSFGVPLYQPMTRVGPQIRLDCATDNVQAMPKQPDMILAMSDLNFFGC